MWKNKKSKHLVAKFLESSTEWKKFFQGVMVRYMCKVTKPYKTMEGEIKMKLNQKRRRKMFWCLAMTFMALGALCLCLSSCQLSQGSYGKDAEKDAYEAKMLYYQTQVQTLSEELKQMEEQMVLLRQEYILNLEALEDRLNASEKNEAPEQAQQPSTQPTPPEGSSQNEPSASIKLCDYSYRLEQGGAIITAYLGNENEVHVPAAVDGYIVIGLDDRAFADTSVQKITLPETVKSIGWFTFFGCQDLQEVSLPHSLTSIGYASFDGCAPQLCLFVPEDSYAEQYALSFGLRYQKTV